MKTHRHAPQSRRKPSIVGRQDPAWQTAHNLRDWPYHRQFHAFRAWDRKFNRLHPVQRKFLYPTNEEILEACDATKAALIAKDLRDFIQEAHTSGLLMREGQPSREDIPSVPLAEYGFRDGLGHPLENCVGYQQLIAALRLSITAIEQLEEVVNFEKLPPHYRTDAVAEIQAALEWTGNSQ